MWRIVQFLGKYGNVLLFLFLELVALLLIINRNDHQNTVYNRAALSMTGKFFESSDGVYEYFALKSENRKIQEQNIRLKKDLIALQSELNAYKFKIPYKADFFSLPDSVIPSMGFNFIPCRAINNSVEKNYNYVTLNKGTNNGVMVGMGLLSPKGIVGRVVSVSNNYALAISLLNQNFRVSARINHSRDVGSVTWYGGDETTAELEFIPRTSPVSVGDTVITSGLSTVFPENFAIGWVEEISEETQDGFLDIKVKLATNFRSLDNLYLVEHVYQAEIDSLELLIEQE